MRQHRLIRSFSLLVFTLLPIHSVSLVHRGMRFFLRANKSISNLHLHFDKLRSHSHRILASSLFLRAQASTEQQRFLGSSTSFHSQLSPSIKEPPAFASKNNTMPQSEYEKWVRRLYMTNLFHPVKMGLDNMEQLHEALGHPMNDPKVTVIHIAGTNGKGSVALKMAKALEASNPDWKVGLFCSPHVSSFRERMQVNGELISEDEVVELLPYIYKLCEEHDIPATFFEVTTALAFAYYAKHQCNFVVLETGLGGRLDATNVIQAPAVSVITSIGLEHTRILGDTIEQIAREKAGIMKAGRPVIAGPHVPHHVMRECQNEKGAGPYYISDEYLGLTPKNVPAESPDDWEDYDLENARISKAALLVMKNMYPELLDALIDETINKGISRRPPCRFEEIKCGGDLSVILDVAHNPPAMDYLVQKLQRSYPNESFRVVVGMSSDKDLKQCGDSIMKMVNQKQDRIHLVQAAHPRAATIRDILKATHLEHAHYDLTEPTITKQITEARKLALENHEMLVVCGSVFIMAEVREALGFDEPRDSDYIAEVAGANLRHGQENFGNSQVVT